MDMRLACGSVILGLLLTGCASSPGAPAASVTSPPTAAQTAAERDMGGRAVDARIQTDINGLWMGYNPNLLRWLDLKVYNRRVLVLGRAPSEDIRAEAIRLAWKPAGVREVINEVTLSPSVGLARSAQDKLIGSSVDTRLALEKGLDLSNYTTRTLDGVVYVMGFAPTPQEKEKVLTIIRNVAGVKRVVSYIE